MGKSKGMRRLFVGLLMITLSLLSERAVEKAMAKTNRSFDEYKERLRLERMDWIIKIISRSMTR